MGAAAPLEIGVEDLDRMRRDAEPPLILDVREPWEFQLCAVPDSVNIPLSTLPQYLARFPSNRPLVVLCHHGMRSMQAVAWLRRNGLDAAINLRGGIDAWARRIDPAMTTY